MELTKEHRQALISRLQDTTKELSRCDAMLLSDHNAIIQESLEIDRFLCIQRINLIEQSLIDNEIDY